MNLPLITSNSVVTASDTNNRNETIENYLNGGISTSDFQETAWIGSRHIRQGSFYGAPAPRSEMVSGDVHHRSGAGREDSFILWSEVVAGEFVPIPGMAATIHADRHLTSGTIYASVRANWYAREHNNGNSSLDALVNKIDLYDTALFKLFVNGTAIDGTTQRVGAGTSAMYRATTKCLSLSAVVALNRGINDIYVGARFNATPANNHFRMHVKSRRMVVEVFYL